MIHKWTNIVGQRFGLLVVIEAAGVVQQKRLWRCRCDCGKVVVRPTSRLSDPRRRSCGCQQGGPTHGHTAGKVSPTYSSWRMMVSRCTQPSNPAYAYYQKVGVKLSKRWERFENFLADMGERPSLAHTIDRHPDKAGNYEAGNCRWATRREQANNRVTNRLFTYRGTEMSVAELARATGLSFELLRHRLLRAGWPVEEAVNAPKSQGSRRDLKE